jgi:hypothetical protein
MPLSRMGPPPRSSPPMRTSASWSTPFGRPNTRLRRGYCARQRAPLNIVIRRRVRRERDRVGRIPQRPLAPFARRTGQHDGERARTGGRRTHGPVHGRCRPRAHHLGVALHAALLLAGAAHAAISSPLPTSEARGVVVASVLYTSDARHIEATQPLENAVAQTQ